MNNQFTEADLLPISALQHLIYCPRQCALIHNERLWAENRLTVEGTHLHEKAHGTGRHESRPGVRVTRGLPLRSLRLGIAGVADVVEFHTLPDATTTAILPIEYKRGRPKKHDADKVQLCAQAMCLEEMLNLSSGAIAEGRLFYGRTRRRADVILNNTLRQRTRDTIVQLRELVMAGTTPAATYDKNRCDRCSLIQLCLPATLRPRRTAASTFSEFLSKALAET